jgi:Trk-type K+ transport system membrane component
MFAGALGNPTRTSFEPMNVPKMDVSFLIFGMKISLMNLIYLQGIGFFYSTQAGALGKNI